RMPDADRVIVHTPGSLGIADTRRQEATAYITPALLADRAQVQYSMIEGLTLVLVTACDRYPVHAAAIARGGGALLLAGPPGTGERTGGSTTASKAPVSPAEVQAFLKQGLGLSRARFGASLDEALRRLAGAGGWRVSLSANPADAMPMFDDMLAELDAEGSLTLAPNDG